MTEHNKHTKLTNEQYEEYVSRISPKSKTGSNLLKAFIIGGITCAIGQGVYELWRWQFSTAAMTAEELAETAFTMTSVTMIFLGVLLTVLGVYDNMAKQGGAGTLVPITGFANAMAAPAIEFKSEGFIAGTGAKMFVIAGPVIVYGTAASAVYGVIYYFFLR
jgi:stage V sporulation protein AC